MFQCVWCIQWDTSCSWKCVLRGQKPLPKIALLISTTLSLVYQNNRSRNGYVLVGTEASLGAPWDTLGVESQHVGSHQRIFGWGCFSCFRDPRCSSHCSRNHGLRWRGFVKSMGCHSSLLRINGFADHFPLQRAVSKGVFQPSFSLRASKFLFLISFLICRCIASLPSSPMKSGSQASRKSVASVVLLSGMGWISGFPSSGP